MGIFGPFKGPPYEWKKILTLQNCFKKSLALPPFGSGGEITKKNAIQGVQNGQMLVFGRFPYISLIFSLYKALNPQKPLTTYVPPNFLVKPKVFLHHWYVQKVLEKKITTAPAQIFLPIKLKSLSFTSHVDETAHTISDGFVTLLGYCFKRTCVL